MTAVSLIRHCDTSGLASKVCILRYNKVGCMSEPSRLFMKTVSIIRLNARFLHHIAKPDMSLQICSVGHLLVQNHPKHAKTQRKTATLYSKFGGILDIKPRVLSTLPHIFDTGSTGHLHRCHTQITCCDV